MSGGVPNSSKKQLAPRRDIKLIKSAAVQIVIGIVLWIYSQYFYCFHLIDPLLSTVLCYRSWQ